MNALVKPEWFNPTGSFKDRGTSVMMSVLAEQGIDQILEDSSGNGGASVAAYAAAAGIRAKILAPESTSPAKLLQARAHGAEVQLVPGSRTDTSTEAIRQSQHLFYASHNWHPFFLQGIKLLAYELWEQLGFRAPDNVVIPAGAGSLVLGCDLGFTELLAAGQIQHAAEAARRPTVELRSAGAGVRTRCRRGCGRVLGAHDRRGHRDRESGARPRSARGHPSIRRRDGGDRRRGDRRRHPGACLPRVLRGADQCDGRRGSQGVPRAEGD